jgi:PAS domain S-box-containing protein
MTEADLAHSVSEDIKFQQRLKALQILSLELAQSPTFDALCRRAAEATRDQLGFDRVALWFYDADFKKMRGSFGTNEQGLIRDERNISLEIKERDQVFLHSRDVIVNADTPLFDDRGQNVGQGWMIRAPLWDGSQSIGFTAVDNLLTQRPLSRYDAEFVGLFGVVMGGLITRQRAEEALRASERQAREFQERLKALNEVNLTLSRASSLNDLFRLAIEAGQQQLGFERIGLFLYHAEAKELHGTYGVDPEGNIQPEAGIIVSAEAALIIATLRPKGRLVLEDAPLYKGNEIIGQGWNIAAAIWDNEAIIGHLVADNLLTQRPLRPHDVEVLVLYASSLGHLITRKRHDDALHASEAEARDFQALLKTLNEISLTLSKTLSIGELCRLAVQWAQDRLGFERIAVFFYNPQLQLLEGTFGIDTHGMIRDERGTGFSANAPEIVATLRPKGQILLEDVALHDNEKIVGHGWNAAAAIWDEDEIIGYLVSDNLLTQRPLRRYEAELLSLYADMLGQLINRKRADDSLRASEAQAREFQDRLKTLNEISLNLSKAPTVDELCRLAIEYGRHQLGFERIGLFFYDAQQQLLHGTYGTDTQGNLRDEHHWHIKPHRAFMSLINTRERRFVLEPAPLYDFGKIIGEGWNMGAAITDGNEVMGFLVSDNMPTQRPLYPYESELFTLFADTLGHLINRKRAEDSLRDSEALARHFQEQLRTLHALTIILSHATTIDELCARAVESGCKMLGFDRLSLWFFEPGNTSYMTGTYGIDETGNLRDEHTERIRWRSNEECGMRDVHGGRARVTEGAYAPLMDHRGTVVGEGWCVEACLWDGNEIIGWLSADNYFTEQPLTEYTIELLALYAATIGHVTRSLKINEALDKERSLLRTILAAVPDAIFVKNMTRQYMMVNRLPTDDLLHPVDDIIGLTAQDIFVPHVAQRLADEDDLVLKGQTLNVEETGHGVDGSEEWYYTTKLPLRDTSGQIQGVVGILRNVTEIKISQRRSADLELERARVGMLREFITNLSHDLKHPLSNINTSLYLLQRLTDPEKQRERLAIIKQQTELLERILNDILTMSRLDNQPQLSWRDVDINASLKLIEERLQNRLLEKNIQLMMQLAPDLPFVTGDTHELYRVLANIAENAVTYNQSGGEVHCRTYTDQQRVIIEIKDTGTGITPEDLPHIFEYFYRADKARSLSQGGTGLGLSIARRIVELHNGTIQVESVVDVGSIFRVQLPFATTLEKSNNS